MRVIIIRVMGQFSPDIVIGHLGPAASGKDPLAGLQDRVGDEFRPGGVLLCDNPGPNGIQRPAADNPAMGAGQSRIGNGKGMRGKIVRTALEGAATATDDPEIVVFAVIVIDLLKIVQDGGPHGFRTDGIALADGAIYASAHDEKHGTGRQRLRIDNRDVLRRAVACV